MPSRAEGIYATPSFLTKIRHESPVVHVGIAGTGFMTQTPLRPRRFAGPPGLPGFALGAPASVGGSRFGFRRARTGRCKVVKPLLCREGRWPPVQPPMRIAGFTPLHGSCKSAGRRHLRRRAIRRPGREETDRNLRWLPNGAPARPVRRRYSPRRAGETSSVRAPVCRPTGRLTPVRGTSARRDQPPGTRRQRAARTMVS